LGEIKMTEVKLPRAIKPKRKHLWDGHAECLSEDYDAHGGGAFGVEIECFLYDAKNVRKLIRWLHNAEKWMTAKELYR
jgi:hypothetical protein